MESNLLTVKQAAEFLQLKPRTIYGMVKENTIPYIRIGRSIRFDTDAIKAMVVKHG